MWIDICYDCEHGRVKCYVIFGENHVWGAWENGGNHDRALRAIVLLFLNLRKQCSCKSQTTH